MEMLGKTTKCYREAKGGLSKMWVCLGWIIGGFSYTRGGLRETMVKSGVTLAV